MMADEENKKTDEPVHEDEKQESSSVEYPDDYKQKLDEGEAAYANDDLLKAKEVFLQLTTIHPDVDRGWYGLAKVYFKENSYEEAARAYKKCLKVSPTFGMFQKFFYLSIDNPNRLYEMAQALYREGLNNEALKFTDKLVEMEISPDVRNKVLVLREELHRLINKEIQDSSVDYKKSSRTAGILVNVIVIIVVLALAAFVAFTYMKTPKATSLDKGIVAFKEASKLRADFRLSEKGGPQILNAYKTTEKIFQEAVEKNPDNAEAHFWLANTYMELMEVRKDLPQGVSTSEPETDLPSKIEDNLQKAIEINDKYSDAYMLLGRLKMEQKKMDESKELFNKAIVTAKDYYKGEDIETNKKRSYVVDTATRYIRYLDSQKGK